MPKTNEQKKTHPLLFLSKETEFYIDVIEVSSQGASGALHNNCSSLQGNVDIFWDVDSDCWEWSSFWNTNTWGKKTANDQTPPHGAPLLPETAGKNTGGPEPTAVPAAPWYGRNSSQTPVISPASELPAQRIPGSPVKPAPSRQDWGAGVGLKAQYRARIPAQPNSYGVRCVGRQPW